MPLPSTRFGRPGAVLLAALGVAALVAASSCGGRAANIHETDQVKSNTCITCHSAAFRAASRPSHVGQMPETCESCHATSAWSPAKGSDHPWWPLANKHVGVSCVSCHTKGFAQGDTSKDCQSCHRKDYDAAKNPVHTGGYPLDCAVCHSDVGFKPSTYKHAWPLEGKHATAACVGCHTGQPPKWLGTPKECKDCHQKDADAAKNPVHLGFASTCTDCHSPAGWRPSSYVHKWPLQGKHVLVACNQCHTGNPPKYAGTTTDCYGCHKAAADATQFAGHATFPRTCLDCHVMSAWKPAITGLHPEAKFPRTTGKHANALITCQNCHILAKGTSAAGQNTDCVNCHLGSHIRPDIDTRHAQLNVPNYPVAAVATNFCLQCHPGGLR